MVKIEFSGKNFESADGHSKIGVRASFRIAVYERNLTLRFFGDDGLNTFCDSLIFLSERN